VSNILRCRNFSMSMKSNRAIVFPAWGAEWIDRIGSCIRASQLPPYPIFLMTDAATDVSALPAGIEVVRRDCQLLGKARKTEFFTCLPEQIETALLLDADTRVIDDISLGFEKAEQHGIAVAAAPHYSLADFRDFRQVMLKEGVTPLGQIIYNSGVLFCKPQQPEVRAVFDLTLAYGHFARSLAHFFKIQTSNTGSLPWQNSRSK
jgi:hypothetical protein